MIDMEYLKVSPDGVDVAAGRAVAEDPDAPRRSVARPRMSTPGRYAGTFAPPYKDFLAEPHRADWEYRWDEHVDSQGLDDDLYEADVDTRLAVYDAMPEDLRHEWDEAWREDARSWLDATDALFGDGEGNRPGGFRNAERIRTVDGGELLLFAHGEDDTGTAMWMEAVRYLLGEVAEACGITEPETWDVR